VKPKRRSRPKTIPKKHTPSDLAAQVAAFRGALSLLGKDDEAALARWRAIAKRWPTGPLRQEVDLRIIETLIRLERWSEGRLAGQAFCSRHPSSPKVSTVRRLLEAKKH
jgi:hypothetical protein